MTIKPAYADGMIHIYDRYEWYLFDEEQQLAAINHENGIEKMILLVKTSELKGEKAVWIFPVPAKPEETRIDITKGFLSFRGYDVEKKAFLTISDTFSLIRLSQVYTLPLLFYRIPLLFLDQFQLSYRISEMDERVVIYEHIEKMGLTTELITTKDSNSLYNYLTNKGLELPLGSRNVLGEYVGKDYSFVVSWISDVAKFKEETKREGYKLNENNIGIAISFPTEKIYFPLKPTSVYGSKRTPILIYVIGHVTPELNPKIMSESQVNYYIQWYYSPPSELLSFFNGKTEIQNLKYTKIRINSPSVFLTEDLWIKDSTPFKIILSDVIERTVWVWGITLFVLSSCLASLFSGLIVFRKEQISMKKFALFGLFNFFTLIGFGIATIFLKTKKLEPELENKLESVGIIVFDHRKILFVVLFTILFIILTIVFQHLLYNLI